MQQRMGVIPSGGACVHGDKVRAAAQVMQVGLVVKKEKKKNSGDDGAVTAADSMCGVVWANNNAGTGTMYHGAWANEAALQGDGQAHCGRYHSKGSSVLGHEKKRRSNGLHEIK